MVSAQLHLGVAIDGAGHHPAAWRVSAVEPAALFTAAHYLTYARLAEAAKLDFVTLDDTLALQPGVDVVKGRLDALLTFAAIAPATSRIGLVPTVTTTHTEPFHISTSVATLDYASHGRAGVLAAPSRTDEEAAHFGRRPKPTEADAAAENADVLDVIARLWDSWEDDAIIRDGLSGRFIDRDKLHYVDFEGSYFSVKGPSITPRPPQGHPVTFAYEGPADVRIGPDALIPLTILLGETEQAARDRRRALDELHPWQPEGRYFVGTPAQLVDELLQADAFGYLVRPAVLPDDLDLFTGEVVPALRAAGVFRDDYTGTTLREHLGLGVAVNQYQGA